MLITAVRSRAVSLPLQLVPYSVERAGTKREWGKTRLTPHRPKPSLQYVIVEIDTDDGITGVGEACTDIGFFGEPVEEVQSAIDLEARSDLHRRQSVQLAPFAAGAPQQVRLPAAHLAGARSRSAADPPATEVIACSPPSLLEYYMIFGDCPRQTHATGSRPWPLRSDWQRQTTPGAAPYDGCMPHRLARGRLVNRLAGVADRDGVHR